MDITFNFKLHFYLSASHSYLSVSQGRYGVLLELQSLSWINTRQRENIRKVATIYNATDLSIPRSRLFSAAIVITRQSLFLFPLGFLQSSTFQERRSRVYGDEVLKRIMYRARHRHARGKTLLYASERFRKIQSTEENCVRTNTCVPIILQYSKSDEMGNSEHVFTRTETEYINYAI